MREISSGRLSMEASIWKAEFPGRGRRLLIWGTFVGVGLLLSTQMSGQITATSVVVWVLAVVAGLSTLWSP